jgi:hypothetical protein
MAEQQRMAQRDKVAGALGGHHPSKLGDNQNVPFFHISFYNKLQGFWLHSYAATGNGHPFRIIFVADINHFGAARFIKMG